MSSVSRPPSLRSFLTIAVLALVAHVAAISSPTHVRAMTQDDSASHMESAGHDCDACSTPLPGAPFHAQWDACGLGASLPVGEPALPAMIAVAPFGEPLSAPGSLVRICASRDHHPPPPADLFALFQDLRL
jgi:hypothetical protein